jgi:hypothetical protein
MIPPLMPTAYRVSHNTWDYKNALGWPLNDNIESWEVSHFEAKDHTFQTCQAGVHGFFCKIVGVQSRNKCSLWNVERKE